MDPLSLTAGILAVIGAAKVVVEGLQRLNSYRKAPQEILGLLSDVTELHIFLEGVGLVIEHYQSVRCTPNIRSLTEHVGKAGQKVHDIKCLLDSPFFRDSRLNDRNKARIVWLQNKNKVKRLQIELRAIRVDLGTTLSLLTMSSTTELKEIMSATAATHAQNSTMLATVLKRMTHAEQITSPIQEIYGTVPWTPAKIEPASSTLGPDLPSLTKSTPTLNCPTRDRNAWGQISMPTRYKCIEWCSCICHRKSSFKSPWILRSIFGAVFIDYSIPSLVCNEHSCRRYSVSSFRMTFHLPKYLVNRYIAMVWKYAPLEGPAFSMRMPRVMPWTHLLWHYAIRGDIVAIQRLFSEGKASPYDTNLLGGNALIYAATRRNAKLGQFLMQQGADADIADIFGRRPVEAFFDAVLSGHIEAEDSQIVKNIFEGSDYVETRCFTLIHKIVFGIVSRDLETELRSSTATINTMDALNRTPICWATLRNDSKSVSTLLAFNADPNLMDYQGKNCLFYVRSTDVCKRLLSANINLHARGRKCAQVPLHSVCSCIETAEIPDVVDLLVHAGADVDVRNGDGETPLMNAVYIGNTSIARKLIDLGANVNIPNYSSQDTAIHFAASFDRFEILPLLLEKGADYQAKNIHGRNILHMAAHRSGAKTVAALSKANLMGLDTSLQDYEGKTVYDYLAEREILSDMEVGLHENFQKLLALHTLGAPLSTSPQKSANFADTVYDLESRQEPDSAYHLPGAYPISGED